MREIRFGAISPRRGEREAERCVALFAAPFVNETFMDFAIEHFMPGNCNRRMRERILITGPGGRVGVHLVPLLREHFALRLFDTQKLEAVDDDEIVMGDIQDFEALRKACVGVRAVLHLAAIPDEDDFHTKLLSVNLAGAYNAFEAARQSGVKKFLFPSSGQTVLNNPKGARVTT